MINVTDSEFVKIWQAATDRKEVAEACGMTVSNVSMRALKLRRAGVKLKLFPRGRKSPTVNVADLNALIEMK